MLFVLCIGVGLGAYALKQLGVEISFLQDGNLPNVELVILYLVLIVAAAVLSQVFSFWFAKAAQKTVFGFFDSRFLPKQDKETYTVVYGERLERVVLPSFYATVVWELITQTIPGMFFVSVIMGGIAILVLEFSRFPAVAVGLFLLTILVNFLVIPWAYWLKEWRRRYTKFVVFTFMTYYVRVRTPVLSLLFALGTLPKASRTPIKQIQEIQISADPQDFDEKFQTSWVRDQYTSWLAKKKNLRTIFLRSIFNRAEDVLFWVDNGPGLENLLNGLIDNASRQASERSYIEEEAMRLKVGDRDEKNWRRGKKEREATMFLEKFKDAGATVETYDIFRVEDPGIYDDDGNYVEENAPEEEVEESDKDVSSYFSQKGRKNDFDFTEVPDPNEDRLL
ncbi:TPA: hypothetical protein DHW62_00025 [candidate division WWE3 bacterium]|nr:hypothetical protein [candidate division WWE3 bacterium]